MSQQIPLYLTPDQREHLENLIHAGHAPARTQTRARILLLTDRSQGTFRTDQEVAAALGDVQFGGDAVRGVFRVDEDVLRHSPHSRVDRERCAAGHEIRPADTLLHGVYFPIAESAVRLARDRPDAALDALRAKSAAGKQAS